MYRKFYGIVNVGLFAYQAAMLFRLGCTGCGSTQWASMIGVQDSTQTQGTTYMANGAFTSAGANADMADAMAVRFKRWPNICQADSIIFPPRNYELLIGDSLSPIAVFGNVSPVPQTFYCIFRIRNLLTGQTVYQVRDSVNNLAGGATQRIYFAPWYTYTQFTEQVGSMFVEAIASPFKNIDQFIGDYWPFDDTLRQTMFVIKQVEGFEDFNNNFSNPVLLPGTVPDALLWVNINANVVDGDNFTYNPPPPRGLQGDPNGTQLNSPVILMDRRDANGNYYNQCASDVGDTIISFPVDIHSMQHPLLGFSYERAGKLSYPRWYDLSAALGPERTVTQAGNPNNVYRAGDSLTLEFADPSQITNIKNWSVVWGQDGGKDFDFTRAYIPVSSAYVSPYFRFRVRLKAKNDFEPGNPGDDADAWYLDNFSLIDETRPELEASFIRFNSNWSYTSVPASQATSVPIEASVANNGGQVAQPFGLNILVYPNPITARYIDTARHINIPLSVYNTLITIPVLGAGKTLLVNVGQWNARQAGPGQYDLVEQIVPKNYDAEPANDSTYNTITMQFGDSYSYDNGTNDIPDMVGTIGSGLNLPDIFYDENPTGDSAGTGTIAVKFTIYAADTIYGANMWFGSSNLINDPIRITLYQGSPNVSTPGSMLADGCIFDTTKQAPWDTYNTYLFTCGPIILQPGDYWIGVSQLTPSPLELGGSASRSSVDWVEYDSSNKDNNVFTLNYPELNGHFALENTVGSNYWYPFEYPIGTGSPAYSNPVNQTATRIYSFDCEKTYNYFFGQGTWIPMIRPYFGIREFGPRSYCDTCLNTVSYGTSKDELPPIDYALAQNYPNPFSSSTQISYTLPSSGNIVLKVYDMLGREIKTLVNDYQSAQTYSMTWDGRSNGGTDVPSGAYVYKLTVNGHTFTKTLTLIR
jgi:hypothetical protein